MRLFYYLFITLVFFSCSKNAELIFDENNGGLFLPRGFQSLVVHDGVGQSRHLAVNDNGDKIVVVVVVLLLLVLIILILI